MSTPQASITQSEYQDVVQTLQALTAQHERTYRLKVGELILTRFFGGDARRFSSKDTSKDSKFSDFLTAHASEVAALDLSEQTLRRCVRVKICYDTLPAGLRDRLAWSATLAISATPAVRRSAEMTFCFASAARWAANSPPLGRTNRGECECGRAWRWRR